MSVGDGERSGDGEKAFQVSSSLQRDVFGSETAQGFDSFGAPFVLSALVFQELIDGCADDHPLFWSDILRPYVLETEQS
ncbi:hypothetical protein CT676_36765 [Bradyrhizobium sp. MOS001]|uniref:hypothetical protein n=1 Tax=unclassified Bradyrhizobium TaxID=2631580 RepID=UPI00107548EE|nr:hypothetical protein [Bradyrhizobium sp. MOS001]TFW56086.1 hypothetical protein CT676_36765 [Bradyrhizobium sp. MOS001]